MLESVGSTGLFVVTLALLSAQVTSDEARASAFATYTMVGSIVYLGIPPLTGFMVDHSSWRLVAVVWALSGLVILGASRRLLPRDDELDESRELLTPALVTSEDVSARYAVPLQQVERIADAQRDAMATACASTG